MQDQLKIGLAPLARTTFDIPLAEQVTAQVRARLYEAGFALIGPETLVTDLESTRQVAAHLAEAAPDLVLAFQATFADSTMIQALAEAAPAPLLLWAVPEARTGGRLRLNSFCGINLGGHALKRSGQRFDYIYAAPDAPGVLDKITALAQAGRARRRLHAARIGRVGENPEGFEPCKLDAPSLVERFGVEVVQFTLDEVFERVLQVPDDQIDALLQAWQGQVAGLPAMDQPALRKTVGTYIVLRDLAAEHALAAWAVRCWPEFFTKLGCAACGAMSMLTNDLMPCSCEADVNGAITQLLLQWISGSQVFGTDMVAFEVEENLGVLWHCGKAPLAMADPAFEARATIHSNRRLPLLLEFPLKPGRVTFARLSESGGDRAYRLVIGGGEMVRAPLPFSGTSGVLRFDRGAQAALDTVMNEGLEHHIELTYGDYLPALTALAQMLEIPVVHL